MNTLQEPKSFVTDPVSSTVVGSGRTKLGNHSEGSASLLTPISRTKSRTLMDATFKNHKNETPQQPPPAQSVMLKHVIPELSQMSTSNLSEMFERTGTVSKWMSSSNLIPNKHHKLAPQHINFKMTSDILNYMKEGSIHEAACEYQSEYYRSKLTEDISKLKHSKSSHYVVVYGDRQGVFPSTERYEDFQNKYLLYEKDMIERFANPEELNENFQLLMDPLKRKTSRATRDVKVESTENSIMRTGNHLKLEDTDQPTLTLEQMHQRQQDSSRFPVKAWKAKALKNRAKIQGKETKAKDEVSRNISYLKLMGEPVFSEVVKEVKEESYQHHSPRMLHNSNTFLTEVNSVVEMRPRRSTIVGRERSFSSSCSRPWPNTLDSLIAKHHSKEEQEDASYLDEEIDNLEVMSFMRNYDSRIQLLNIIRRRGTQRPYECMKFPLEEVQQSNRQLELVKKRGVTFNSVLQYDSEEDVQDFDKLFPPFQMKNSLSLFSSTQGAIVSPSRKDSSFSGYLEEKPASSYTYLSSIIDTIHHKISSGPNIIDIEDYEITDTERKIMKNCEDASVKCKKMMSDLARIKPKPNRRSVVNDDSTSKLMNGINPEIQRIEELRTINSLGSARGPRPASKRVLNRSNSVKPSALKKEKFEEKPIDLDSAVQRYEYGKKRFIAAQAKAQNELLDCLDEREQNREQLFKSKKHMTSVYDSALAHAESWSCFRVHLDDPVKKRRLDKKGKEEMISWRRRNRAPKPNSKVQKEISSNMWTMARKALDIEDARFHKSVLFYKRLMVFLDYINAPSHPNTLEFLNGLRDKLKDNPYEITKERIFFGLMIDYISKHQNQSIPLNSESRMGDSRPSSMVNIRTPTPTQQDSPESVIVAKLFDNREFVKIIQFLCTETSISSNDLSEFEKTFVNSHRPIKELTELKRRLREKEDQKKKEAQNKKTSIW